MIKYISYKLGIPDTSSWCSFQFNREFDEAYRGSIPCLAMNLIGDINRLRENANTYTIGVANIKLQIKENTNTNHSYSVFEAANSIIHQLGMVEPNVSKKGDTITLFFPGGRYSWPEFYAGVCIYHQFNEYAKSIVEYAMELNELLDVDDLGRCFFLASGLAWWNPPRDKIYTSMFNSYFNTGHWFCAHRMNYDYNTLLKWKSRIPDEAQEICSLPNDFIIAGLKYFLPDNKAKNRLLTDCSKYVGKAFNRDNLLKLYEIVCNP